MNWLRQIQTDMSILIPTSANGFNSTRLGRSISAGRLTPSGRTSVFRMFLLERYSCLPHSFRSVPPARLRKSEVTTHRVVYLAG